MRGDISPYTGFQKSIIEADPVLELAWMICQIQDDDAPLHWYKHKTLARCLLDNYEIEPKNKKP